MTAGVRPAPNLSCAGARLAVPRVGKPLSGDKTGARDQGGPVHTLHYWIIVIILGLVSLSALILR
jgi:hypothetical protein